MRASRGKRAALAVLSLAASALALSAPGATAAPDADAVLSPLAFEVLNAPHPVPAADGLNHLAYEVQVINQSEATVQLNLVQAKTRGKPIGAPLSGDALAAVLRRTSGGADTTLDAGESALLFMDVAYPRKADAPRRLKHRIALSFQPPGPGPAQALAFTGVPTRVVRGEPIEVRPPLRGSGWAVGNGCCQSITSHRGATLSIDGTVHVPERFAIDFVRLDSENRLFAGPADELSSYAFFGDPVVSAAKGKVVRIQDGLPEQVPGALPAGATVQNAGGNYVVVRIARGQYAFYAHLQPGSLRVKPGDRVRAGQTLGLLGNSGNTDAPHLHFHVMDSPSPLQSNGLPFTFTRFSGTGLITDFEPLYSGDPAPVAPELLGARTDRMPLNNQIITFGGR